MKDDKKIFLDFKKIKRKRKKIIRLKPNKKFKQFKKKRTLNSKLYKKRILILIFIIIIILIYINYILMNKN